MIETRTAQATLRINFSSWINENSDLPFSTSNNKPCLGGSGGGVGNGYEGDFWGLLGEIAEPNERYLGNCANVLVKA